ncbi:MAG: hypothetical protein IJF07_03125 [Lachnospiraceae bacterium]|nr:hypothetical protein [Lachnospiraceae bacterium]
MKLLEKIKVYVADFSYSMIGIMLMNATIQLLVYPFLNSRLGAEQFGTTLTLISICSIMGNSFGIAANYSRVISPNKTQSSDYHFFLLIISGLALVVSYAALRATQSASEISFILYACLMIATIIRCYADVEFRIRLAYRQFCIYYIWIVFGYIIGVLFFPVFQKWEIILILAEVLPVIYVVVKFDVLQRNMFRPTKYFRKNIKSVLLLSGTEMIGALVLHADRILLELTQNGMAVTIFYASTVIGKMISLVTTPLNGVVIGHLSKYEGKLSRKILTVVFGSGILLGIVLNGICVFVSHIFVRLLYPDVYIEAQKYFVLGSAGQIFYFLAGMLKVILLKFTGEKYQMLTNLIYLLLFCSIVIPATVIYQLDGMAIALFVVNVARYLIMYGMGMYLVKKDGYPKGEEKDEYASNR